MTSDRAKEITADKQMVHLSEKLVHLIQVNFVVIIAGCPYVPRPFKRHDCMLILIQLSPALFMYVYLGS